MARRCRSAFPRVSRRRETNHSHRQSITDKELAMTLHIASLIARFAVLRSLALLCGTCPKPRPLRSSLSAAAIATVLSAGTFTSHTLAQCETWQGMGGGMNTMIRALTVYNGQVIAGGGFTIAGGQSANHVARW